MFLKTSGTSVIQKPAITKVDLGDIKNRTFDVLIDTEKMIYFDADDNAWKPIEKSI